jgi:hypothetical protein
MGGPTPEAGRGGVDAFMKQVRNLPSTPQTRDRARYPATAELAAMAITRQQ